MQNFFILLLFSCGLQNLVFFVQQSFSSPNQIAFRKQSSSPQQNRSHKSDIPFSCCLMAIVNGVVRWHDLQKIYHNSTIFVSKTSNPTQRRQYTKFYSQDYVVIKHSSFPFNPFRRSVAVPRRCWSCSCSQPSNLFVKLIHPGIRCAGRKLCNDGGRFSSFSIFLKHFVIIINMRV